MAQWVKLLNAGWVVAIPGSEVQAGAEGEVARRDNKTSKVRIRAVIGYLYDVEDLTPREPSRPESSYGRTTERHVYGRRQS